MSKTKPSRPLRRQVMLDAGYRCSVPACAYPDVDLDHIVPEEEGGSTDYENLIALCPNHHRDKAADRIDRKALRIMKANQILLNARYVDSERRLLTLLAEGQASIDASRADWPADIEAEGRAVQIVWHPMNFEFAGLLRDGLIEQIPMRGGKNLGSAQYGLTSKGVEFVKRWLESSALDPHDAGDE